MVLKRRNQERNSKVEGLGKHMTVEGQKMCSGRRRGLFLVTSLLPFYLPPSHFICCIFVALRYFHGDEL